jgi:hypothetical protein
MKRTLLPALGLAALPGTVTGGALSGHDTACTERYPAAVVTGTALSTEPRRSIR